MKREAKMIILTFLVTDAVCEDMNVRVLIRSTGANHVVDGRFRKQRKDLPHLSAPNVSIVKAIHPPFHHTPHRQKMSLKGNRANSRGLRGDKEDLRLAKPVEIRIGGTPNFPGDANRELVLKE